MNQTMPRNPPCEYIDDGEQCGEESIGGTTVHGSVISWTERRCRDHLCMAPEL